MSSYLLFTIVKLLKDLFRIPNKIFIGLDVYKIEKLTNLNVYKSLYTCIVALLANSQNVFLRTVCSLPSDLGHITCKALSAFYIVNYAILK